ncbi:glutamate mutase L [Actinophytocola gossypii]|uniref:Glutamate mutase L n=1 Tax=Actinophytocola gossypii TaxID=2812003 RepID=A0ABT2JES0_9PSEU|nr:glutamate mutase L [Actinophytocola gossypii]MCT2586248.1 glutamate mutase L [Actinophytocola gossypii]
MTFLCLDVGSTWTKGALVAADGTLLGTAQHRTTPPEVLDGVGAVREALDPEASVLACSSAGGGLRLAVVGQERLVSVEAGYRVALSAGAKVVHVFAGSLTPADVRSVRAAAPDVLLLVGGTDGGDDTVLLHNAARLAAARIAVPVVLAGNVDARAAALAALAGRRVVPAANVLPDVGELAPGPARAAIRDVFLRHVIGGKGLSRGPRFRRLVRTVTPDAVLSAVSRLAASGDDERGAVLVVDVGGATTDVYSAVSSAESGVHAVALPADRRTVEGDLGMRVSAPTVVAEAVAERLLRPGELAEPARARHDDVDLVPSTPDESEVDMRIACLAVTLAVRRHLRMVDGNLGPHGAGRLVLSGGVFRHTADLPAVEAALRDTLGAVLRNATVTVDRRGVLGPAGLLAQAGHERAADGLLATL